MPFSDELVNGHTARLLTRAVRTALPGVEPASLRAAAHRIDTLTLRE